MLSKYEFDKLVNDLKRISKALGLAKEEKNKDKRDRELSLLQDELDNLYEDLKEIKKKKGK